MNKGSLLVVLGTVITAYMFYLDNLGPLDRPLFWGDITLTLGCILGAVLCLAGYYLKL